MTETTKLSAEQHPRGGADFAGRRCLVTGSSRGIGLAIARELASRGARLILHGRDEAALAQARDELRGDGHETIIADLGHVKGVEALATEVWSLASTLDVLIHNAGVLGTRQRLDDYPLPEWERVLRVNLTAPFVITQRLAPLLRKGDHPAIVFVSSGAGRQGRARWGAYAVSKFAVEGLSQVLADELREDRVRVNAVDPGATRTQMRAKAYPEEDPLELPTPEEIAPAFALVASPSFAETGQSLSARELVAG
jgi:NAD(P)-dependent dehydrogenase (short-subunit alcohol dehydrogenase family)